MKPDQRIVTDAIVCDQQLAIVEKYDDFSCYIYDRALSIDRRHAVVRETFLAAVLAQPRLFIEAGKSSTPLSKLYAADAGLAWLRYQLRFMARRGLISERVHRVAGVHLAEVGALLGAWIKTAQRKG
jgi:hypothetical protein